MNDVFRESFICEFSLDIIFYGITVRAYPLSERPVSMSKSSLHHERDGLAVDALRDVLPTYWIYKNPADIFNRREYSEDLIIEIVNDDAKRTVSEVEFGVQNKTDIQIRKRHVTVKLQVDDIKRLIALQRPSLIHGYDLDTETSYWIWLNEWYPHHVSKLKGKKKKVSIKIPKGNILNAKAVKKIEEYARREHFKNKIRKMGDMIARAGDYNVQIVTGDNQITTIIDPKHHGAIPSIHPLDEIASKAMIEFIETGLPVALAGEFAITNFPELIFDSDEFTLEAAWLIPPKGRQSSLKIEFIDDKGTVVLKSPFVNLHEVQPGTIITSWMGIDNEQHVSYTFTFDLRANTSSFNSQFKIPPWETRALCDYFAVLEEISRTNRIRMTNLRTEQSIEQDCPPSFPQQLTPEQDGCRRMASALLTIEETLNVCIPIPEKFDGTLLGRAEWITEILRDGAVKVDADNLMPEGTVLICDDPAYLARKSFEHFSEHETLTIMLDRTSTEMRIAFLDHELNLGTAKYACKNVKIINMQELNDFLAKPDLTDDESVRMIFDVDRDEVYLLFENWSPNQE